MQTRQLDTEKRTLFLTLGGYHSVPETYPLDLASEFSDCSEPESVSSSLDSVMLEAEDVNPCLGVHERMNNGAMSSRDHWSFTH
eukprot:3871877-Rhodomonas_salina.1